MRSENITNGDNAEKQVIARLANAGYLADKLSPDFWIDLVIRPLKLEGTQKVPSGRIFHAQIKSRKNLSKKNSMSIPKIEVDHIKEWSQMEEPVFLFGLDSKNDKLYCVHIQKYIESLPDDWKIKKTLNIKLLDSDVFDTSFDKKVDDAFKWCFDKKISSVSPKEFFEKRTTFYQTKDSRFICTRLDKEHEVLTIKNNEQLKVSLNVDEKILANLVDGKSVFLSKNQIKIDSVLFENDSEFEIKIKGSEKEITFISGNLFITGIVKSTPLGSKFSFKNAGVHIDITFIKNKISLNLNFNIEDYFGIPIADIPNFDFIKNLIEKNAISFKLKVDSQISKTFDLEIKHDNNREILFSILKLKYISENLNCNFILNESIYSSFEDINFVFSLLKNKEYTNDNSEISLSLEEEKIESFLNELEKCKITICDCNEEFDILGFRIKALINYLYFNNFQLVSRTLEKIVLKSNSSYHINDVSNITFEM